VIDTIQKELGLSDNVEPHKHAAHPVHMPTVVVLPAGEQSFD
jgi:hypothetical protein